MPLITPPLGEGGGFSASGARGGASRTRMVAAILPCTFAPEGVWDAIRHDLSESQEAPSQGGVGTGRRLALSVSVFSDGSRTAVLYLIPSTVAA